MWTEEMKRIAAQHMKLWNLALERSKEVPGQYEALLRMGREKFVQTIVETEAEQARQAMLRYQQHRDRADRKVFQDPSKANTADTIQWDTPIQENQSILGGNFTSLQSTLSDPVVIPRKSK